MRRFFILILLILAGCGRVTPQSPISNTSTPLSTSLQSPPANLQAQISVTIDRSAVPALSFNELTLRVTVGNAGILSISDSKGQAIPYHHDSENEWVLVTTAGDDFTIVLDVAAMPAFAGIVTKSSLKDNKQWAWSHSFDDNVELWPAIEAFTEYGWTGTLYQIGRDVEDTRDEDWIVDASGMQRLLAAGWSMGNHSWGHECDGDFDYEQTVLMAQSRLGAIVAASSRPDYHITAFAAPCFDGGYHPIVKQLRQRGEVLLQFNESGADYLLAVDAGTDFEAFTNDHYVVPFSFDKPIGRDGEIAWDGDVVVARMAWIAGNTDENLHIWYNTFAHGGSEGEIGKVLEYVNNLEDEVWVAPADQIYSYFLVREFAAVEIVIGE